jgi:DNA-binding winged helix-turn-helix (wHTH) protein
MAVTYRGKTCTFRPRLKLLFALLVRLTEKPGRRVTYAALGAPGDVWDGGRVEDSTIRGTVARLRTHLRDGGLGAIADALHTMSDRGDGYAWFEPPSSEPSKRVTADLARC